MLSKFVAKLVTFVKFKVDIVVVRVLWVWCERIRKNILKTGLKEYAADRLSTPSDVNDAVHL